MELFERVLSQDWLDNMLVDLLGRVLAEAALFV
jgi:hypothetical protein